MVNESLLQDYLRMTGHCASTSSPCIKLPNKIQFSNNYPSTAAPFFPPAVHLCSHLSTCPSSLGHSSSNSGFLNLGSRGPDSFSVVGAIQCTAGCSPESGQISLRAILSPPPPSRRPCPVENHCPNRLLCALWG